MADLRSRNPQSTEEVGAWYDRVYHNFQSMVKQQHDHREWNAYERKDDFLSRMQRLNKNLQRVTLDET